MTTSSPSSIQNTMTTNISARHKTVGHSEVGNFPRPAMNNSGFVVYPTYIPPIINQTLPGVLNHSQNYSNASVNAPAFHIAHAPGTTPTMFIPHHSLPNHALASVQIPSEQFIAPGSLAFTHMTTMPPAMYLDGAYSGLIHSALNIPSQNPISGVTATDEEPNDAKVSTSNTSTASSAPVSEWKTAFVEGIKASQPSGHHHPSDSHPSLIQPHILMSTPYPFIHASRIPPQQSSYSLSSEAYAPVKDRPMGPNSAAWQSLQESTAYYPPGSVATVQPHSVQVVPQQQQQLPPSSMVQAGNAAFSDSNSITAHSQRFVLPAQMRLVEQALPATNAVPAATLSYVPIRRHTNSSGFEEPEILTAKNDAEDTHYMSEDEDVLDTGHGTIVTSGHSRSSRHDSASVTKSTNSSDVHTHPSAFEEQKKPTPAPLPVLSTSSESETRHNVPEESQKVSNNSVDFFRAMYPEEKLRHLTEDKISELRNHHRAIMDLLNSKDVREGRSPQDFMSPVVSFTMLPTNGLLSQPSGVVYRSHIVTDNYLHPSSRPQCQLSPGEQPMVANVINEPSLVAVPPLPSGAMPSFITPDNTPSPSPLVPVVSGTNSRGHFFYPGSGISQPQPPLLYVYEPPLYPHSEAMNTDAAAKLINSAYSTSLDRQVPFMEEYSGLLSKEDPLVSSSTGGKNLDLSIPVSSVSQATIPTVSANDEVNTGAQRKVGRFQVQVIPITEKTSQVPGVPSTSNEPPQAEVAVGGVATTTQTISPPPEEIPVTGAAASKVLGAPTTVSGTAPVSRFRRARIEECFEAWEQNGNSIRDWRSKNPESNVVKMVKKSSSPLSECEASAACNLCVFQNEKMDSLWQCDHKPDFNPHFNTDVLPKAEMWLHGERHGIHTGVLNEYGLRHHPLLEATSGNFLDATQISIQRGEDLVSSQQSASPLIMQSLHPLNNRRCLRPSESASLVSVQRVIMSTGVAPNLSSYHFRSHSHTHAHNCHPIKECSTIDANSSRVTGTMASSSNNVESNVKGPLLSSHAHCHSEHYHSAASSPPPGLNPSGACKSQEFNFVLPKPENSAFEECHQRIPKSTSPPRNGHLYSNEGADLSISTTTASQSSQAKPPPGSPRMSTQMSDLPPQELVNCVRPDPEGVLTNPTLERFHIKLKEEQQLQSEDVCDAASVLPSSTYHRSLSRNEENATQQMQHNTEAALQRLEERIAESLEEMRQTLLNCFRNEIQSTHRQIAYLMEQNTARQRHLASIILCLRSLVSPPIFESLWQACNGGAEPSSPTAWNVSYPSYFVSPRGGPSGQQSVPEENPQQVLSMPQYGAAPMNVVVPSLNTTNHQLSGVGVPQMKQYYGDKASAVTSMPVPAGHPFNGAPRVTHC